MTSGVYEILNTVNGKRYIGSAVNFSNRWRLHQNDLHGGKHHSQRLQRAWNKYGADAFKFLPMLICEKSMLLFYEQRAIDIFHSEYNICLIAGSTLGMKHTLEARANMAAAQRGKTASLETRARMSSARTGIKCLPETKTKIGNANRGRKHGPRSPEAVEKSAAAKRGKKRGPMSDEQKVKISIAKKGNTSFSAESRNKMSTAAKLIWAARKEARHALSPGTY